MRSPSRKYGFHPARALTRGTGRQLAPSAHHPRSSSTPRPNLASGNGQTAESPLNHGGRPTRHERIVEQIKAATLEQTLYAEQANRIEKDNNPIRRAMFTTSQLGICTEKVGRVAQRRSEQARFKDNLIAFYDVARRRSHRGKSNLVFALQDMATGYDFPPSFTAAAPLFPYKLPPDVLVSLFGEDVGDETATVSVSILGTGRLEVRIRRRRRIIIDLCVLR